MSGRGRGFVRMGTVVAVGVALVMGVAVAVANSLVFRVPITASSGPREDCAPSVRPFTGLPAVATLPGAIGFLDVDIPSGCPSATLSIDGPPGADAAFSVDGARPVTTAAISSGAVVRLRMRAPEAVGTAHRARLQFNGVASDFTVLAQAGEPLVGGNGLFGRDSDRDIATLVASDTVLIALDAAVPFSLSIGADTSAVPSPRIAEASTDFGRTWSRSGVLVPGAPLQLRVISSAEYDRELRVDALIGGVVATWFVDTRGPGEPPGGFGFVNVVNAAPNRVQYSREVTIDGIPDPITLAVTDPAAPGGVELQVNGGAWVRSAPVALGNRVRLRMTSPATLATSRTGTLSATSPSGAPTSIAWSVTTRPAALAPTGSFSWEPRSRAEPGLTYESEEIVVTGLPGDLPASVSGPGGPELFINGRPAQPAQLVRAPVALRIRMRAPDAFGAEHAATVLLGQGRGQWTIATRPFDARPGPFGFADAVDQQPNALVESDAALLDGFEGSLEATVTPPAGVSALISRNGAEFASPPVTVIPGDRIRVRMQAPPQPAETRTARVSVGAVTAPWTVATVVPDVPLGDFTFPSRDNAEPGTAVTSAPVRLVGIPTPTTISSVAGPGAPLLSVEGGPWAAAAPIRDRQTVRMQLTTATGFSSARTETIELASGQRGQFTVTTRPARTAVQGLGWPDRSEVEPDSLQTSGDAIVDGLDQPVSVTVTGPGDPQIRVNGGAWGTAGVLTNGDAVAVRLTAASGLGMPRAATVRAGTTTAAFLVTTRAAPPPPLPIRFERAVVDRNVRVESSSADLIGLLAPTRAVVTGDGSPQLLVNGAPVADRTLVLDGDTLQLRVTSPATYGKTHVATVTLPEVGLAASFEVRTAQPSIGLPGFAPVDGLEPNVRLTSNEVTLGNFDGRVPISIAGGDATYSVDGGPFRNQPGEVGERQRLRLRMTGPSAYGQTVMAILSVGGSRGAWSLATRVQDTIPDPFDFEDLGGFLPDTLVEAPNEIRVTGLEIPVRATIGGVADAALRVNGGPWLPEATVFNGDRVRVRGRTSAFWNRFRAQRHDVGIAIGGGFADWRIFNRVRDDDPDGLVFPRRENVGVGSEEVSPEQVVSGFDVPLPIDLRGATGPRMRINGGPLVTAGTLAPGDRLQIVMTAAPQRGVETVATLRFDGRDLGGWVVTTLPFDTEPDPFDFRDVAATAIRTATQDRETPTIQITGLEPNYDVPVTVTGPAVAQPRISINGGPFVSSGTIRNGQSLRVQAISPDFNEQVTVTVTVGLGTLSRSDTWRVSSPLRDLTPDSVTFPSVAGSQVVAPVVSDARTLTGFEGTLTLEPVPGSWPVEVSTDGGATWRASADVTAPTSVRLRLETGEAFDTDYLAAVRLGTGTFPWTVRTAAAGVTLGALAGEATEQGGEASFTLRPTVPPVDEVSFQIVSAVPGQLQVLTSLVTFTRDAPQAGDPRNPTRWDVPQTIRVTGVQDNTQDGDQDIRVNVVLVPGEAFGSAGGSVIVRVKDINIRTVGDPNGDGILTFSDGTVARSCWQYKAGGTDQEPATLDGVYTIDPAGNNQRQNVVCDMTRDGGGWTLALADSGFSDYRTSLATRAPTLTEGGAWANLSGMPFRTPNGGQVRLHGFHLQSATRWHRIWNRDDVAQSFRNRNTSMAPDSGNWVPESVIADDNNCATRRPRIALHNFNGHVWLMDHTNGSLNGGAVFGPSYGGGASLPFLCEASRARLGGPNNVAGYPDWGVRVWLR